MSPALRAVLWRGAVIVLAILASSAEARAGGPIGADGTAIHTSRYGVDLTQTPVLAGARLSGLAGAYVAVAEGVDGDIQTPVSPAVRPGYSFDHFDYELGLGLTLPASIASSDFFNTGKKRTELASARNQSFVFATPAANLVWGDFGVGVTFELQNYSLTRGSSPSQGDRADISALFTVTHLQAAQRLMSGQLVVGAGLRILSLDVTNSAAPAAQANLFSTTGAGFELGALIAPIESPFRIGAAFHSRVSTEPDPQSRLAPNAEGDRIVGTPGDTANEFYLPDRVDQPWDLNLGFAFQLGPRPFNPRWTDPIALLDRTTLAMKRRSAERRYRRSVLLLRLEKEGRSTPEAEEAVEAQLDDEEALDQMHQSRTRRELRGLLKQEYKNLPRQYILISTSLLLTGAVDDAVGIESFLERVVARSGRRVVYSPRLGVESEFVPNWLKLRAGAYDEPSRFDTSGARLHGTFGFDVRLFPWTVFGLFDDDAVWRLSGSVDGASRYFGWGLALGIWH